MESFSFPKNQRLLNREDFVNVSRSGRRYHTRHFVLIFKQNGIGVTRLGITVSKKTGNAVQRNRIKRLIREFFRLNKSYLPQGYNIIAIAKKDAGHLDFWGIKKELAEVLFNKKFLA
ncbi:MAG: ribonuclease P protein component [Thermodesulfobacteriota bacterium]|nr:ribonuclease P protein component [Thermodesulfobacteriota bacterium]